MPSWQSVEGAAFPLGATWIAAEQAFNFALYSKHATSVKLLLYREDDVVKPVLEYPFSHLRNKSGRIWHCRIPHAQMRGAKYYAYRVDGPKTSNQYDMHAFDVDKILLDPYATSVYFPEAFDRDAAMQPGRNDGEAPLGVLHQHQPPFDWAGEAPAEVAHEHDLVIYEMHIKGFTQHPNSGVSPEHRGKFLGVIERIDYLKDLGVTAVELLPIHQFDPQEGNYWGYMTLNFFAPHEQYAVDPNNAHNEFRQMVRALHEAGIEVILDVVFNHTAEGDHRGPCYSYKGIDNSTYYMTTGETDRPYRNYSGTGNTMHCANRYVARMILDSLRNWVARCHVDGFRFDLASVFTRRSDGSVSWGDSALISAIRSDPMLGKVRLIAEPWDARGLVQLGAAFPGKRWFQWNGRYRDDVRRFVRGDSDCIKALMYRLYGSDDLFPDDLMNAYHPFQSVNYVNSHDGFTLYDLVAYNHRHNEANGENNQDGHRENFSWNCGWEGDQGAPPEVLALRRKQVRNFFALLMVSNGTPMFCAGDEFLNSQGGNNNPYNQDNETTWLDWRLADANRDIVRFFRLMIAFRKAHPSIARSRFWREDVHWYGTGREVDMSAASRHLAFYLDGRSQDDADLYVMINAHEKDLTFQIQEFQPRRWHLVCDTSRPSPDDVYPADKQPPITAPQYIVPAQSVVVLVRPRPSAAKERDASPVQSSRSGSK
ncbi:MAG: isoamylase [Pirellulaceae bacterium]|nr:isoamylase [Pirellulaceae bacterium]